MHSSPVPCNKNTWFSEFGRADSASRRLFAFPYGGAGSSAFRGLSVAVPGDWVLSALVAPGRERRFREPPFSDVHTLLDALMPAIQPLLDRPFAFLGHSVGALIAFELCRRLRREGLPMPELLCVSARVAPAAPRRTQDFHTLSGDALVNAVLALNQGSLGPAPMPDFIRAVEPQLRADFAITDTYRYTLEPPLDLPLLAVGSRNDPSVQPEELHGWKAETKGPFEAQVFPDGGHFFLDRHAAALAAHIDRAWPGRA